MYTSEPGPMTLPSPTGPAHPFTVVIVRGMVLRETYLGDRSVCELLGTHDLIDTRPDDDGCLMPSRTEYVALEQTTFVVLDDRFATAARKWPGCTRSSACSTHGSAPRLAAPRHARLSRVEDRVIALFCDLSDRWGRVTPLGIRIDVPLTHTVLGRLVGARRPTVTLALSALAADGLLRRDRRRQLASGPRRAPRGVAPPGATSGRRGLRRRRDAPGVPATG
jgi:hypothetical protein